MLLGRDVALDGALGRVVLRRQQLLLGRAESREAALQRGHLLGLRAGDVRDRAPRQEREARTDDGERDHAAEHHPREPARHRDLRVRDVDAALRDVADREARHEAADVCREADRRHRETDDEVEPDERAHALHLLGTHVGIELRAVRDEVREDRAEHTEHRTRSPDRHDHRGLRQGGDVADEARADVDREVRSLAEHELGRAAAAVQREHVHRDVEHTRVEEHRRHEPPWLPGERQGREAPACRHEPVGIRREPTGAHRRRHGERCHVEGDEDDGDPRRGDPRTRLVGRVGLLGHQFTVTGTSTDVDPPTAGNFIRAAARCTHVSRPFWNV